MKAIALLNSWCIGPLFFAIALPQFVIAQTVRPIVKTFDQRSRTQSLERTESFIETAPFLAKQGVNEVTLTVDYAEGTLYRQQLADGTLDQLRLRHRAYNGRLCGPPIRVRPGETLDVRLVNRLPNEPDFQGSDHMRHRLNVTNLHTHGLFVSPSGRSDNIYLDVRPGEEFQYRFLIPENHPAGTFWYHAHFHGSVALQLASGMAGALIVEGGVDKALKELGIDEKVLLFQQFVFHRQGNGEPAVIDPADFYGLHPAGSETKTAINGQITPIIRMRPGEIQRWRMIHAGIWETIELSVEGHDLYEFASDGLTFGTLEYREIVRLQPGNRSDILLQAKEPGTYLIRTRVDDKAKAVRNRLVPETYVAKLVVAGDPIDGKWPDDSLFGEHVPPEIEPIEESEIVNQRDFTLLGEEGPPSRFQINGREFEPNPQDILRVRVNTAEEWDVTSKLGAHPFHQHVNIFEVLTKNEQTGNWERLWRDTVFIPAGQTVKLRTRFRRFTGKTVLHCHILDHEDMGMMAPFEIVDQSASTESPNKDLGLSTSVELKDAAPKTRRQQIVPCVQVAQWSYQDPLGQTWSSRELRGTAYLLDLHLGVGCPHCARQLLMLSAKRERLEKLGLKIVTVSANEVMSSQIQSLRDNYSFSLPVVADSTRALFKSLKCLDSAGQPLHGTFLIDKDGCLHWCSIGEEPEMDLDVIVREAGVMTSSDNLDRK